jgi:hypothetical protein
MGAVTRRSISTERKERMILMLPPLIPMLGFIEKARAKRPNFIIPGML